LEDPGPVFAGAARFSPDGHRLALVTEDSRLVVRDVASGTVAAQWRLPAPGALAFSPDGSRLAVVDNTTGPPACRFLDGATGRRVGELDLSSAASEIAWSPDGSTLCAATGSMTLDLWNLSTGSRRATLEGHTNSGLFASFHPSGALLATNGWEARI